jgi:integrase/recombinase XerD
LEPTLQGAVALARSATGPLSPHLEAFVTSLIDQRYAVVCLRAKAWHATAFDAWLAEHNVDLVEVSEAHIDRFHRRKYRPRSDCRAAPRRHETYTLEQLLRYLRERGVCAPAPAGTVPADAMVANFERFLLRERGLAAGSISYLCANARTFLVYRFGSEPVDLGAISAADILDFVQRRARLLQPRAVKQVVSALRTFLRYANYRGEIDAALIGAAPAVAVWSTTPPLPRAISAEHAQRAIDGCDPTTAVGRRDRAILLLLARLGLRGGEVLALRLDDIDWSMSRLHVRGKNGRECLMPLPVDVGEAIAAYLQDGRPASSDRHVFLRSRAPLRCLLQGSDAIGSIVRNALVRAGVDAPHKGAHQFRHALAVRMLQGGASLLEIGELLRHRSPLSTSIYARVDVAALRSLALPWPGCRS